MRKTALVIFQLNRRNARIHQDSRDGQAPAIKIFKKADEGSRMKAHPLAEALQIFPGQGKTFTVLVDGDHAGFRESAENMMTVAAAAHRAIHKNFFSGGLEYFQDLFIHDGVMKKIH